MKLLTYILIGLGIGLFLVITRMYRFETSVPIVVGIVAAGFVLQKICSKHG